MKITWKSSICTVCSHSVFLEQLKMFSLSGICYSQAYSGSALCLHQGSSWMFLKYCHRKAYITDAWPNCPKMVLHCKETWQHFPFWQCNRCLFCPINKFFSSPSRIDCDQSGFEHTVTLTATPKASHLGSLCTRTDWYSACMFTARQFAHWFQAILLSNPNQFVFVCKPATLSFVYSNHDSGSPSHENDLLSWLGGDKWPSNELITSEAGIWRCKSFGISHLY